jgi:hypothetical protein
MSEDRIHLRDLMRKHLVVKMSRAQVITMSSRLAHNSKMSEDRIQVHLKNSDSMRMH